MSDPKKIYLAADAIKTIFIIDDEELADCQIAIIDEYVDADETATITDNPYWADEVVYIVNSATKDK